MKYGRKIRNEYVAEMVRACEWDSGWACDKDMWLKWYGHVNGIVGGHVIRRISDAGMEKQNSRWKDSYNAG